MFSLKYPVVLLALWGVVSFAADHNSEKTRAPALMRAEEEVDEALSDWCRNGFPTKTTEECICATHNGFFCEGDGCQSGYGMSFFPKSCERCACKPSDEWGERKGAIQSQRKKNKKGRKSKKNKKGGPTDD